MKNSIYTTALRWLLVLPVSFLASGTVSWLVGTLASLTHTVSVVAATNSIEQHFYGIAANFAYGWAFVAAGTVTAPNRRPTVAITLILVLAAAMSFVAYNGTPRIEGFLATMWAALRIAGYVGGAVVAVTLVIVDNRSAKTQA
jgi:hypothetical protein